MTEFWQAYGSWIVYGVIILAFVWLHGGMHGHGGHGNHTGHGRSAQAGTGEARNPKVSPQDPPAQAHQGHATGKASRGHGGCC